MDRPARERCLAPRKAIILHKHRAEAPQTSIGTSTPIGVTPEVVRAMDAPAASIRALAEANGATVTGPRIGQELFVDQLGVAPKAIE